MKPPRLPLIVDTNLLLLFVVGTASRAYIGKHKRVDAFIPEDYDRLCQIMSNAAAILVTPNILTETSNLAAHIREPARTAIFRVFHQVISSTTKETYIASHIASSRSEFLRLGLTDAAILEASSEEAALITTDLKLYLAAQAKGVQAINFNQVRDSYLSEAFTS